MKLFLLLTAVAMALTDCNTVQAGSRAAAADQLAAAEPTGRVNVALGFLGAALRVLPKALTRCAASPSCRLTSRQTTDAGLLAEFSAAHTPTLALAGAGETPPGSDTVTWWSPANPSELLVDAPNLVAVDAAGVVQVYTLFRGIAELTQRLAEVVPGTAPGGGESLGAKVSAWVYEHAEVARIGTDRSLTTVDFGRHDEATDVYLADAEAVTYLTPLLVQAFACADGSAVTGLKLWSSRWTHGVPGTIFKQPFEGRLNVFCQSGRDHLGDDALVVVNFRGEVLTADPPDVSLMACSQGGCYPHRDPASDPAN